jgi:tryptophanyl-tRNA synthetase
MPGLDGQKMSKSYGNTITLREPLEDVEKKIKTMPTDPARVRLKDPGDPEKCPVWQLHLSYSNQKTRDWVVAGCKSAGIGCLECKKPVIEAVVAELEPIQKEAAQYERDPDIVRSIIAEGCETARECAKETIQEVRSAMGLNTW